MWGSLRITERAGESGNLACVEPCVVADIASPM
jgi:hypothetical protein